MKKDHPLLSIIIPSYNQGKFIKKTLNSILNQDCSKVEIIIMDGGSTDSTMEIIKEYKSQLDIIYSGSDKGQSHAFNKGLSLAKGDWIGWQNSDDCYKNNSFKEFFKIINNSPKRYDVIFSDFEIIDNKDQLIQLRKLINFSPLEYTIVGGSINNCSAFFRKSKLLEVNGLDINLHHCMDHDLYLKLSKVSSNFKYVKNSIWGEFRIHDKSKGSTSQIANQLWTKVRKRYYPWYNKYSLLTLILFYFFKIRKASIFLFNNEWQFIYNKFFARSIHKHKFYNKKINI